jgi:hypothetical protein
VDWNPQEAIPLYPPNGYQVASIQKQIGRQISIVDKRCRSAARASCAPVRSTWRYGASLVDTAGDHIEVAPGKEDQPAHPDRLTIVYTGNIVKIGSWLPEYCDLCHS